MNPRTLTITGHADNVAWKLRELADKLEVNDPGVDWPEWYVVPLDSGDGLLTIRFVAEFDEDDDPTIVWELSP